MSFREYFVETRRDQDIGELRKFGLLMGLIFLVLGIIFLFKGRGYWPIFLGMAGGFGLTATFVPYFLRPIYGPWMALSRIMGQVVTCVILTVFFFLVVTPIGLMGRIMKKEFLVLDFDDKAKGYWLDRDEDNLRGDIEKQF